MTLTRAHAIRRLVALGLRVKTKSLGRSQDRKGRRDIKQRARELAVDTIDEIADTAASPQDQARRKRRLVKGPEEFQKSPTGPTKPDMKNGLMQLQLPHWLIIAGIVLTTIGTLGVLFRGRKDASSEQSAKERKLSPSSPLGAPSSHPVSGSISRKCFRISRNCERKSGSPKPRACCTKPWRSGPSAAQIGTLQPRTAFGWYGVVLCTVATGSRVHPRRHRWVWHSSAHFRRETSRCPPQAPRFQMTLGRSRAAGRSLSLHEHRPGAGGWIGNDLLAELTSQSAQKSHAGRQVEALTITRQKSVASFSQGPYSPPSRPAVRPCACRSRRERRVCCGPRHGPAGSAAGDV